MKKAILIFPTCDSLLRCNENVLILNKIMMDKEKWLLYKNVEWKRLWGQWNETLTTTWKVGLHPRKEILCIWWHWKEVLYYELLSENQTINSNRHCFQLVQLKTAPQWKSAGISQQKMHNLPLFYSFIFILLDAL